MVSGVLMGKSWEWRQRDRNNRHMETETDTEAERQRERQTGCSIYYALISGVRRRTKGKMNRQMKR